MTIHSTTLLERYRPVHKTGLDCRITAGRNILDLYGHRHSYTLVQGLASSFYFSYVKQFDVQDLLTFRTGDMSAHYMPVSGQRSEVLENLAYLFNTRLLGGSDQAPEQAERDMLEFVREGIPVMVAVAREALADSMGRPLPVSPGMNGLKYGGHFVVVVGADLKQRTVQMFDSDHTELIEMPLHVLSHVRTVGDNDPNYMMKSHSRWQVLLPEARVAPLPDLMTTALRRTVHHFLSAQDDPRARGGLNGLHTFCAELPQWCVHAEFPVEKVRATVFHMHMMSQYISGGALGRKYFGMFLRQCSEVMGSAPLAAAATQYADVSRHWNGLLATMQGEMRKTPADIRFDGGSIKSLLAQIMDCEQAGFDLVRRAVGGA